MDWILLVGNVMLVNVILSGDNALAISLAAGRLPAALQKRAIGFGSVIAILLLILFTAIGTFIIRLPVLKAAAGLLLLWIAIRLVIDHIKPVTDQQSPGDTQPNQLSKAIGLIVTADLGMELDNAMAMLGAANGEFSVLLVGFLGTIPFLIFGSRMISWVFGKAPWIVWLAAVYIAWIAGNMVADDPAFDSVTWNSALNWAAPGLSIAILLAAMLTAWLQFRHHRMDRQALAGRHPSDLVEGATLTGTNPTQSGRSAGASTAITTDDTLSARFHTSDGL